MKLKNYQEDLVLNAIDIVTQDRQGLRLTDVQRQDVAAYTLNRLPARYIMSERGFTRLASQYWVNGEEENGQSGLSGLIELMLLVNRAIDVVTTRRRRADANGAAAGPSSDLHFWHNFPQFIGRIVDAGSKAPLYGASVTLLIDDKEAAAAEPGWDNPYMTNAGTRGFFSFWPQSVSSEEEKRSYQVVLQAAHPDYQPARVERQVETSGELDTRDYIYGEEIVDLEYCALQRR